MRRLAILTLLAVFCIPGNSSRGEQLHVAWWNVENLFDTVDDPAVQGDEEFTPAGPKEWDEARLKRKLGNLAGVIKKMNGGKGPDVFAVCEVENKAVVERLAGELAALGRTYRVAHKDSPSERGIDVAIVYDAAKVTLKEARFHAVPGINTRDVAEAELEVAGGRRMWVFANHWPSQAHPEEERNRAADVLRKRVDEILAWDAKADVVILGDLNDHPGDPAVKDHLKTTDDPAKAIGGMLYDTTWAVQKAGRWRNALKMICTVWTSGNSIALSASSTFSTLTP
jgi:endonuclease/exonuclease/phosphatase family metal-dependent hydrolase